MEISRHGRIDDLGKLLLGVQPAERSSAKKAYGVESVKKADRVEISQAAKDMQHVRALSTVESPARTEKVASLKQVVETGTYTVSGRTVSDQLLRHTLVDSVL